MLQKRERADEFGWRHFGDIYADHENAYSGLDTPVVSHYNNQYDAIAGFAMQFMRSGDPRWHAMMNELAWHVVDIDPFGSPAPFIDGATVPLGQVDGGQTPAAPRSSSTATCGASTMACSITTRTCRWCARAGIT